MDFNPLASSTAAPVRRLAGSIGLALALSMATPAHAVLIDFDDLTTSPSEPTELTDQYLSQGVWFEYAAIQEGTPDVTGSGPNVATDHYGPGMYIHFIGSLPNRISLTVSSYLEDAIYIGFSGVDGLIEQIVTDGWEGPVLEGPPYYDKQLITFEGADINRISLGGFYGRRGSVVIDDLQFDRVDAEVPEPSSAALLLSGLAGLLLWRQRNSGGGKLNDGGAPIC